MLAYRSTLGRDNLITLTSTNSSRKFHQGIIIMEKGSLRYLLKATQLNQKKLNKDLAFSYSEVALAQAKEIKFKNW